MLKPSSSGTNASPPGLRHSGVGGEEARDQVADEPHALLPARGLQHRRLEALRIPAAAEIAPTAGVTPARLGAGALVELREEALVTELLAQALSVLEQALGQIEARDRRLRVRAPHEVRVLPEDRGLHVAAADHVVGHEQELAALRPGVVLGHHVRQLGDRAGLHVAREQQVQHRHEMALAGAEAAVQIGRLAAVGLDGLADER